MPTLFNEENSNSDEELKINKDYAESYNNWRQKEELNKLKTKYGENALNAEDDESSSSSSEDNDENDEQFDKDFYKTLACLKKKDPRIYDERVKFFDDVDKPGTSESTETKDKQKKPKKEKALFLRDYERKIVMERNGRYSSEDEDNAKQEINIKTMTYVEEQQQLKNSFKHLLNDEDENEDTGLLKIKEETEDEKRKKEESYKEWLKGQQVCVEIDAQEQEELKPLRDFWTDPKLDANETFLRDYILNNKYMDKESAITDLDYDQIAHDSDENLSEDEKNIKKQEEFEHKYNFRFEEPDREFIKRYPRTMENLMRKKDTRRAQKRMEVRQRKEENKQRIREELKQLKSLKRKEIEEKIEKLKEITGNYDMRFDNVDFDADFDPTEHDRKMKELFNDEYYADAEEDMKPEFPEIDEELNIERTWDNYDPNVDEIDTAADSCEPHCEDPDFNMDADYNESQNVQSEIIDSTKTRKRKRRSKFGTLIAKEKPKFDPKKFPSYEEYFDQYYSLDYEDMIGDLPCRFKYRKVVPNDYGLSVEEILIADDKELNKWCSLKKALQHRPEHVELRDVQSYKQKAMNDTLKQKILKSLYIEPEEKREEGEIIKNNEEPNTSTSKKRRRQKKKTKVDNNSMESTIPNNIQTVSKNSTMHLVENNAQKDSHIIKNDKKQDNSVKENNVTNKNKKRKNKLTTEVDVPSSKKMKIDSMRKKKPQLKENNIIEGHNSKLVSDIKSTEIAIIPKKDKTIKKKSKIKTMKHKKDSRSDTNSTILDNAERLKIYGINAKKLKNKLKYGNKKV